jgi:2-polyprenyl-6-methoxyphenol hydroxylase-like FAD-dependent oxidoreductase
MSSQSPKAGAKPEVMIVGAGLGGLFLALLLEQINVPYHIYERSAKVKPLGMRTEQIKRVQGNPTLARDFG